MYMFVCLFVCSIQDLDPAPWRQSKVIIHKSRGEVSLVEQDTIECVYVAYLAYWNSYSYFSQFSIPTSRNAFDRVLPEFHYGMSKSTACTCANNGPCTLGSARKEGGAGQPCLWWSQGCSIGCDYCLTDPRHPINNGTIPTTPIDGNPPHADKAGFRKSYCENPKTQDVLPKEYWTMNIHAVPRAKNDSYRCK